MMRSCSSGDKGGAPCRSCPVAVAAAVVGSGLAGTRNSPYILPIYVKKEVKDCMD